MYGQAVLGPPGSGKTTYCRGVASYLRAMGRSVAVVNLDPANNALPYKADVDISELVNLTQVMEEHDLGPNGGLVFCMEYIEQNLDWLIGKLESLEPKARYVLFDFPGQVELYTHGSTVQRLLVRLQKWGCHLAAVHLVDAHHCSDPGKFISAVLMSLTTMIRLELPHVNVLSKMDLMEQYGKLAFSLNFYTDAIDLRGLLPTLEADAEENDGQAEPGSRFMKRYRRLNEALCELIEDFSLVTFQTLNIQDVESVNRVLAVVDKCNGYLLGAHEKREVESGLYERLSGLAFNAMLDYDRVKDVQDRYYGGEAQWLERGSGSAPDAVRSRDAPSDEPEQEGATRQ